MKSIFTGLFAISCLMAINAQQINEFHYDNDGGDVGEFVEISIPDPQPGDLSMYQITHYNGNSSGGVISSTTLDALPQTCADGICYYVWNQTLQNGPDGIALTGPSGLIEFISYEDVVTAVGGPIPGVMSTEIPVTEGGSTPIGTAIARNAMGNWETGIIATPGTINTNALPISLSAFAVNKIDQGAVQLLWTTETEFENDYFAIEHSIDGQRFNTIAEVKGAGNSLQTVDYNFVHETPARGMNYYRLKQVDYSRAFSFSEVRSLKVDQQSELQVWPSLVQNETKIQLGDKNVDGELILTNVQGQTILSRTIENQSGTYDLDLSQVANGAYILSLEAEGTQMSRRIFVQK